jgi:hypothetical protein
MSFNCKHCGKEYSSQSSRSNHIRIYHSPDSQTKVKIPEIPVKKTSNIIIDEDTKKHECCKCGLKFNSRQTKWAHEKKCKENNNEKIEKLEKENQETKKELENLKNMLQKALKIHPKTLNKINNQLNNSGTINNVTIIQLGHENLSEILNTREKKNILNRQAMSLNDLVDLVHVSGKYKNFQNVYITNLQSTFAYKFDEKANKFIAVNKNELLNDLVDSRMYDIEKFYEEICPDLEPKKADQIKKFIDRMGNEEDGLKGIKKEEIKLILYNNKDKIKSNFSKETLLLENEVID